VTDEVPGTGSGEAFDLGAYCRQIEDHLTRVNGGHLVRIVGPGFDLVRQWAEERIPLSVVFRGIDSRAARHRTGRARRPLRIEFCEPDVRDVFDGWRRAVGVSRGTPADPDGISVETVEPRRRSLTRHLDRAIDRMGAAAGRLDLPDGFRETVDRVLQQLVALRDAARKARGPARDDLAAKLAAIDRELIDAARSGAAPDVMATLRAEAEQDLAPYRDRLAGDAWQRSIDLTIARLLRDRFGLPTIGDGP
jgi:hypothetical protein